MFKEIKINGMYLPRPDENMQFTSEKVKKEYETIVVYEQEAGSGVCNGTYAAGIDQGVENIIAFVSNDGKTPILYN